MIKVSVISTIAKFWRYFMFSLLSHLVFICLLILPGISSAVGTLGALNDTGITQCQDGGNNWGTCTATNTGDSATNPRQDGRYGRDAAAAAGQLTKIGAGAAGFDYTKIANDGSELYCFRRARHRSQRLGLHPRQRHWLSLGSKNQ
ncbi:hypothetical protein CCP3SC5AM1_2860003 [Gammaproteobacteria bacterium]